MSTVDLDRMDAARQEAIKLGSAVVRYAEEPCCEVPLALENPQCVWHGYRSLTRQLVELIPHTREVENRAMVHVLDFLRRTALKDAQVMAVTGSSAQEVVDQLVAQVNRLMEEIQR